jgi:hypothetical protein
MSEQEIKALNEKVHEEQKHEAEIVEKAKI